MFCRRKFRRSANYMKVWARDRITRMRWEVCCCDRHGWQKKDPAYGERRGGRVGKSRRFLREASLQSAWNGRSWRAARGRNRSESFEAIAFLDRKGRTADR